MRWPWTRRENREASYTDALVRYLIGGAEGGDSDVKGSGALEVAAGMIGRAFASARPVNAGHAAGVLTPACLQLIGREMVRTGEALHVVQVGRDGLELIPVHVWDVRGDVAPSSWVYRVDLAGPTRQRSRTVAEADVVSCKWATDPARAWCGIDPLTFAHLSGQLHAKVVEALRDEAGGPRGHLVPIPKNPDATIDSLIQDDCRPPGCGCPGRIAARRLGHSFRRQAVRVGPEADRRRAERAAGRPARGRDSGGACLRGDPARTGGRRGRCHLKARGVPPIPTPDAAPARGDGGRGAADEAGLARRLPPGLDRAGRRRHARPGARLRCAHGWRPVEVERALTLTGFTEAA